MLSKCGKNPSLKDLCHFQVAVIYSFDWELYKNDIYSKSIKVYQMSNKQERYNFSLKDQKVFSQFLQFTVLYSSATIFMHPSQSPFSFLPFCPSSSILSRIIENCYQDARLRFNIKIFIYSEIGHSRYCIFARTF